MKVGDTVYFCKGGSELIVREIKEDVIICCWLLGEKSRDGVTRYEAFMDYEFFPEHLRLKSNVP